MSLIKKSNELVIPSTVKMMIYGQAGMGGKLMAGCTTGIAGRSFGISDNCS